MRKPQPSFERHRRAELDVLFERANKQWDQGNLRSAFRLFLAAANAGNTGCQINLGNFYNNGIGVKRNRTLALRWYRRAYRRGERAAASNIGVMYRDEKKLRMALKWFERAVKMLDGDANLEIAKIYLQKDDLRKASHYLKRAIGAKPDDITQGSSEEAAHMLKQISRLNR